MRAVGAHAFAHRAHEVCLRPAADAGVRMRRDVRPVEGTEGRLQRAAARVRRRILARLRMAADAARGLGKILAALGIALRQSAERTQ